MASLLNAHSAKSFATLLEHFKHYMSQAGSGGRDIGKELLAHMSWFYRWRFFTIRRNQDRAKQGLPARDAEMAASRERDFAIERAKMEKEVNEFRKHWESDQVMVNRAEARLQNAQMAQARAGIPIDPGLQSEAAAARAAEASSRNRYLSRKAQLDTYADDRALGANMAAYDARLIADAQAIIAHRKKNPPLKLRPHYANLVAAYEDEFVHGRGLRDEKLIAFFDTYVHDSLAGFAQDATLPSDPRVIYVGGDNKLRFAGLLDSPVKSSEAA